jgi:hypothetical protein
MIQGQVILLIQIILLSVTGYCASVALRQAVSCGPSALELLKMLITNNIPLDCGSPVAFENGDLVCIKKLAS